jgi:hypothetical protein
VPLQILRDRYRCRQVTGARRRFLVVAGRRSGGVQQYDGGDRNQERRRHRRSEVVCHALTVEQERGRSAIRWFFEGNAAPLRRRRRDPTRMQLRARRERTSLSAL